MLGGDLGEMNVLRGGINKLFSKDDNRKYFSFGLCIQPTTAKLLSSETRKQQERYERKKKLLRQ